MCPVFIVILNTPLLFLFTNELVLIKSVLVLAKLPFWIIKNSSFTYFK
jgi:hypothetical protein